MIPATYSRDLNRSLQRFQQQTKDHIRNWFLHFPDVATDFLERLNTEAFHDPKMIAQLMLKPSWPAQHFISGHFADLAFTLFRSEHFFLDLYIWYHQDTNIHDHHFAGAFKVVHGESFHIRYDFTETEKIYPWLEKGKLQVKDKGTLKPGDVKTIGFSRRFIHQNMHTTNPCITLCLRTIDHPKSMLSSYFNKGMRLQLSRLGLREQKLLDAIFHLSTQKESEACAILLKKVSHQALFNCLNGQFSFYNRSPGAFKEAISQELIRRDEPTLRWFENILSKQSQLNQQLVGMLKA